MWFSESSHHLATLLEREASFCCCEVPAWRAEQWPSLCTTSFETVSRKAHFQASNAVGSILCSHPSTGIEGRWIPWEMVFALCAFPVAFLPGTVLLPWTWGQTYRQCYRRQSDKVFSFSYLTLQHHYWFSVTSLQAWLILCKTEDFTAIPQKDLESPDFP